MTMHGHLVVFAKAPRLGTVKSRLARDIGTVAAWTFYRRTLVSVLRRLRVGAPWHCWLAVTPDRSAGVPGLWPSGWSVIAQGAGDLEARMGRVMRDLPPGPAVIVGTDIPSLCRRHIAEAFAALGRQDAVFGPAADGGYWLVGLRRRPHIPGVFAGVRWSSEHALADTVANLGRDATVGYLETLEDVDDGEAFDRWRTNV